MVDSAFPFCIFKWARTAGSRGKLIVYPDYTPLKSLKLPVSRKYQPEGTSRISKVGESMEFHGCREFRNGDEPRHIHWKSSARAGELIIREFQEEHLSRIALITDTFVKPERPLLKPFIKKKIPPEFEAALSLTAAFAEHLARRDYVIDLFAAGPEVYHFQSGRSLSYLDNILDILACVQPDYHNPLKKLTPAVLSELTGIGSAVVILLEWNEHRKKFIEALRERGVNVKPVIIGKKAERPRAIPAGADYFSSGDIIDGKVRKI
jgi:uncharacterized protein (DUF58 family)